MKLGFLIFPGGWAQTHTHPNYDPPPLHSCQTLSMDLSPNGKRSAGTSTVHSVRIWAGEGGGGSTDAHALTDTAGTGAAIPLANIPAFLSASKPRQQWGGGWDASPWWGLKHLGLA
jgi:hypothetical protein